MASVSANTQLQRPSLSLCTFISDDAHDDPSAESYRLEMPVVAVTIGRSRPLPSLPAELHLEIIDVIARRVRRTASQDERYDAADLCTLCTCALVCKLWLSTARTGIWASVRLDGQMKSMSLIRLLRVYAYESGDIPLKWEVPSFGRYISHLSTRETRGNAWDPKWLNDALPHLGSHLPRVQSLEMECVTWEYLSSRSRTAFLEAFRHAKCLTLREFVFHTTSDMYDLLDEFTELEVLTLDGVHCAKKNAPARLFDSKRTISLPPRELKEVELGDVPMKHVLERIIAGKSRSSIQSVRMSGVGVSKASSVGKFLRSVGDSLRKVHIGFEPDFVESGDALVRKIELGENTSLEEVHIFGLVVPSPPPVDPFEREERAPERVLGALTRLLSQIRSQVRVLSLTLYPADVRAMNAIDFEGLSGVFERWAGLEEVRVVTSGKDERRLARVVRERLGGLDRRGVLRVGIGFDKRE